jgi:predicted site-specific integrase-resolvase
MKLSNWARQQGIDYKTAYRWFRAGILPASKQLPTGTILVDQEKGEPGGARLSARVSSSEQKTDLDRQLARLVRFSGTGGKQEPNASDSLR